MSSSEENIYEAVYVFHDSENCYVPSRKERRNVDGRLPKDGKVAFDEPLNVQGVVIVKEVLRNALACKIGKEMASNLDVLSAVGSLKYHFVRSTAGDGPFAPNAKTLTDFTSVPGFHQDVIGGIPKRDLVDNKIKALMTATMQELKDKSNAEKGKILFILISGDRDFSAELWQARMAKFEVVIIHSADSPVRPAVAEILKPNFAPCCWLDIVAAARCAAGNPYYHGLALDPAGPVPNRGRGVAPHSGDQTPPTPPRLSGFQAPSCPPASPHLPVAPAKMPSAAPEADPDKVNCRILYVSNVKAAWFVKPFAMRQLRNLVRGIHPALNVRDPATGTPLSAGGKYPCCELVYSKAEADPPTAAHIEKAVEAMQGELDKIVVDTPITLQGLTAPQLKDNEQLRSFACKESVYYNLPTLKDEMKAAASGACAKAGPSATTGVPLPASKTWAFDLFCAAEALHSYILATAAGTRKIEAVQMAGFYQQHPMHQATIKQIKMKIFCQANSCILKYTQDPATAGNTPRAWIHALPLPSSDAVLPLFKFVLQRGTVRGEGCTTLAITAKELGDFYGPQGTHPHLKATIKSNGRNLQQFLREHTAFFKHEITSDVGEGYGIIYAVYTAPEAQSRAASPLPGCPVPQAVPDTFTKVVLVYFADNNVGRDRVQQMLMSLCPPVTDSIPLSDSAMVGLCRNALSMLQSLALRHNVANLVIKRVPRGGSIVVTGASTCVAEAKAALQACLNEVKSTPIALPQQWETKQGLHIGLRKAASELFTASDSAGDDDGDESSIDSGSVGPSASSAPTRCMYAHIVHGKPIRATLLFLPPPQASAEVAKDAADSYRAACDLLQEVASSYHEQFCHNKIILPSADRRNLHTRFSLYDVSVSTVGILLCGPREEVQEAFNALTVVPQGNRIERHVYKAADRHVAFLLKNNLHGAVLTAIKQAVTAEGAVVEPYTGPNSVSNTALFVVRGKALAIEAAFKRANSVEANWVATLTEKPLCEGRISPAQVKYLTEEGGAMLRSLSSQHGVYLKQAVTTPFPKGNTAPAFRRLLKARLGPVELHVVHGDILSIGCDAIVNPANEQLIHAGGLAAAIADAAGRADIDREGAQQMARLPTGKVEVGTSVCTGAYKLTERNKHAKLVIHAVGPCYRTGSAVEQTQYRRSVLSALDLAATTDRAEVQYISLTLMGTGIYNWPAEQAAELLIQSLAEWVCSAAASGSVKLKRIVLADVVATSANAMVRAVQGFNSRIDSILAAAQPTAPVKRPMQQWYWECQIGDGPVYQQAVVKESGRRWVPYDYDQVMQIEEAVANNTLPVRLSVSNGAVYEIAQEAYTTFDQKETVQYTQMRVTKGVHVNFKRAVRCEPVAADYMIIPRYNDGTTTVPSVTAFAPADAVLEAPLKGLQEVSQIELENGDATATSGGYSLYGPPARIARVETALLVHLEAAKKTSDKAIDLSTTDPEDWTTVLTKLRAHLLEEGVDAEVIPDAAPGSVLAGDARMVRLRACGEKELALAMLSATNFVNKVMRKVADEAAIQWPPNWTGGPFNVHDGKVDLVDVEQGSMEWQQVESEWRTQSVVPDVVRCPSNLTLGAEFTLRSVKRIQNPVAWEAYLSKVRLTAKRISNDTSKSIFERANEVVMKHGTRTADPLVVIRSAEGLDSRYAGNRCFYGRAAYTAEDAIYSHDYAYRLPGTGDRQMLLVRVAAGKPFPATEHKNYITPPEGYHSVYGSVAENHMALMLYHTETCYPSYLLTYREN